MSLLCKINGVICLSRVCLLRMLLRLLRYQPLGTDSPLKWLRYHKQRRLQLLPRQLPVTWPPGGWSSCSWFYFWIYNFIYLLELRLLRNTNYSLLIYCRLAAATTQAPQTAYVTAEPYLAAGTNIGPVPGYGVSDTLLAPVYMYCIYVATSLLMCAYFLCTMLSVSC